MLFFQIHPDCHTSHYIIDGFSIQLNSVVLCCPLGGHYPEILAYHGSERSSLVVSIFQSVQFKEHISD